MQPVAAGRSRRGAGLEEEGVGVGGDRLDRRRLAAWGAVQENEQPNVVGDEGENWRKKWRTGGGEGRPVPVARRALQEGSGME
jgi:hypothetical protein